MVKLNLSKLDGIFKERLLRSSGQLGFIEDKAGRVVKAEKSNESYVECGNNSVTVYYTKAYEFFYGIKTYLSQMEKEKIDIKCAFGEFGVMLDCSRNAVRNVETVKVFLDNLALMGYNQLQLYTEDTYEIKGEPFWGYQRGRYSQEELMELDAYARGYDIELVPCIQTLAHVNQAFRWGKYKDVKDIDDILLVGDERTYELIEHMFESLTKSFSSRKVHIGLDEAHHVGRGKYFDKHGNEPSINVMCAHLQRVVDIAHKYGFEPMMWSDMFFRLANQGSYYAEPGVAKTAQEVIDMVPKGLRLVYWDYYKEEQYMYENMMDRHLQFNNEIVFAGGSWIWRGFAPFNKYSDFTTNLAFNACKVKGIKNVFLTMWGDDGAECSPFAILPALCFASDYAYDEENHERSFLALTGMSKEDYLTLDSVNDVRATGNHARSASKVALYNDPFLGVYDGSMREGDGEYFKSVAEKINKVKSAGGRFTYLFDNIEALARVLEFKAELGLKTRKLYKAGDFKGLKKLANTDYAKAIKRTQEFYKTFEYQWKKENKTFGFEVQTIRLAGLVQRLKDCKKTLIDYASKKVSRIEELEAEILNWQGYEDRETPAVACDNNHAKLASTSSIIFGAVL